MKPKLVLAILVAAILAGGAWFAFRGEPFRGEHGGRGSARSAVSARTAETDEAGPARAHELTAAAAPAEDARPAPARVATATASAEEGMRSFPREHASFDLAQAQWVDVQVTLPAGLPAGDEPALLAFAPKGGGEIDDWSDDQLSKQLGLGDSFAAAVEDEHEWSRRALAPRVRLPFPPDASAGLVFVQSRYLHLDPVEIALPAKEELAIEPELGGYVTGRCTLPAGRTAEREDVEIEFDGRDRDAGFTGFARTDGRRADLRDDLTFEVRALSARKKYAVQGHATGFVGHFELSFEIGAGEHRELTIPFRNGATIEGFVRGDGAPLEGVGLDAHTGRMPWGSPGHAVAQSQEDGSFRLEGLPSGKVTVEAEKSGWRSAKTTVEVVEGETVRGIELELDSGLSVAGQVLWPDGSPAPKTQVQAFRTHAQWLESLADVRSDAEGRFLLGGLEEGAVEVVAQRGEPGGEWFARSDGVVAGTRDLVLTLEEPLPVRGRVVDDGGDPVRVFAVRASPTGRPEHTPEIVERDFESEDGSFELAVAPRGSWRFQARESEGERGGAQVEVEVPSGDAEIELVLPRASSVSGLVVDPGGEPVGGARVHVQSSPREQMGGFFGSPEATSDAEGRFTLAHVESGNTIQARHDDLARSEQVPLDLTPGEARTDLVLRLRVGARITGEVFDAAGEPEAGQNVTCAGGTSAAMAFGFGGEASTTTDSGGRFTFEHVTPGSISVSAVPSEEELLERMESGADETAFLEVLSQMRTAKVEVPDGGEAHVVLGAKPKQPVRVHGKVTEAGSPLPGGQVFAFAEGGALFQGMKFARLAEGGTYELVLDRPGDYVFGVSQSESMQGTGTQFYVEVPEQSEFERDFALPLGRISGLVRGPDGPAPSVPLRLVGADGMMGMEDLSESNSTSSAADGRFAFEHLQPGRYALHAGSTVDGGAESRYGQVVVDGLTVEQDRAVDGLVIELRPAGKLAGLVRDAAGAPRSGLTIFVRDARGRAISASRCMSDGNGRFTYEGIAPGTVTASARDGRSASGESAPVEVRSGETANVELTVSDGTFLRVSLLDDDAPVRARLRVEDEAGRRVDDLMSMENIMALLSEGISSRDRRVGPLPPGKYTLFATTLDGKDAKKSVVIEAGQSERVVKLRLK